MKDVFLITQLIALTAMICEITQFQIKKSNHILAMDIVTGGLWATQFFLMGLWPAVICASFKAGRGTLSCVLPEKQLKLGLIIMLALLLATGIYICKTPLDWFPFLATAIASTTLIYRGNRRIVARLFLVCSLMWVCFNTANHAYIAALSASFVFFSVLIGIYRHERRVMQPVRVAAL